MGQARRSSKSFRRLFIGGFCGLSLAAACGGNPELSQNKGNGTVGGDADVGQHCDDETHCKDGLHCGDGDVCIGACGALIGTTSCGDEACLPDGSCSQGLGNNCESDDDCKKGLVCSNLKHCAVPCTPGDTKVCKKNAACSDSGTCPTDNDIVIDPPAGTGGDTGAGGAPGCIDLKVDFTPQIPTVLLLIDRSGSMRADNFGEAVKAAVADGSYTLGDCPLYPSPTMADPDRKIDTNDWRWNVVRDVLMSPTKGIVKPLEDRVRFGLSLYSGHNGQIKDGSKRPNIEIDATKMCPELIEVPIALGNHQAMFDQFKCSDIADDTPTGESLVAAASTLAKFKEPGPKLIVLATDGEPDNCECPDWGVGDRVPEKCDLPEVPAQIKADVVATATKIHDDGVTIHVINVSTPGEAALQKHLEDVASAGGGMVYPGFSPGALTDAFDAIIDGARSCTIDLDGEIAKGKESDGKVTLDGEELVLGGKNGWRTNSPSQIELLGKACKLIKSGQHDLAITFPCDSFKPPVH